jgi:flavin reductase (DIM6/NTAB) family NADH-FMN oxidoreductase RutF
MDEIPEPAVALGKITSGLFIVTATHGVVREGYLASWIQQVSFSPLMVMVAMKPGRPCYDLIKSHRRFCINIIGLKNGGVMKPFWNPSENANPLDGLDTSVSELGNTILSQAMAVLECEARSSIMPGDHELVFAEVIAGQVLQIEDKPLAHIRKSGLGY